jgi:hypothetical protein
MVGQRMYGVTLRVPRVFYVNSTLPADAPLIEALGGLPVKRQLPNGREVHNLYRVWDNIPNATLPCERGL